MRHQTLSRVIAIAATALVLGACGVRGPLDPPASAQPADLGKAQADSGQGKKQDDAQKPHQGFILDGLLR
jgi:predicted small lipoprotein YifL